MNKLYVNIAALFYIGVVLNFSVANAQNKTDNTSETTISTKDNVNSNSKKLNRYLAQSQRKFGSKRLLTADEKKKRDIIAFELEQRKLQLSNNDSVKKDAEKAHVLKINTFFVYSGDIVGVRQTSGMKPYYLGLGAIQFTAKTEDNNLWKNGAFSLFIANNHGDNPTATNVGDIQVFDNLEAPEIENFKVGNVINIPYRTFFYEFYYQHIIKNFRVLIGQSDLNYDFAYTNYGANFLNSSFGISPEVSVNVPTFSTYPFNAFGIRADYQFGDYFARAAVVSGNPGNHVSNKYSFDYRLNGQDGLFYIGELEKEKMFGEDIFLSNYRVGAWYHTAQFNYLTDTTGNLKHQGDFGAYIMGEKLVYAETEDKSQGLGIFANAGFTPGDYNFISAYVGGGLCYTGLIPKRDSDILSLGIANPILNSSLKKIDKTYTSIEEAIELNYNYIINDHFNIMPCIQYLPNPSFHNNDNNPLIFMLRMSFRNGVLYNNR